MKRMTFFSFYKFYYKKWKIHVSCEIDQKCFFDQCTYDIYQVYYKYICAGMCCLRPFRDAGTRHAYHGTQHSGQKNTHAGLGYTSRVTAQQRDQYWWLATAWCVRVASHEFLLCWDALWNPEAHGYGLGTSYDRTIVCFRVPDAASTLSFSVLSTHKKLLIKSQIYFEF